MFFAITAASLPVLNALLPKHWHTRSDSEATPAGSSEWNRSEGESTKLGSMSTLKGPASHNITIHCKEIPGDTEKASQSESPASSVRRQPDWDKYYKNLELRATAH